jgi:hypothetical protein
LKKLLPDRDLSEELNMCRVAFAASLLFRGTASDEISDKPEKKIKKVEKASKKMFKDFPPGSKEKK